MKSNNTSMTVCQLYKTHVLAEAMTKQVLMRTNYLQLHQCHRYLQTSVFEWKAPKLMPLSVVPLSVAPLSVAPLSVAPLSVAPFSVVPSFARLSL